MNSPGTIKVGSSEERSYLFLCMTGERMEAEREQARLAGLDDVVDFVFVLDGQRVELSYDELKARLLRKE